MNSLRIEKLKLRLQSSRARLYKAKPAFAKPLYDLIYVATKDVYHISVNGACVYFNPDWLQKLEDASLDFMLAHVLMHLELGHLDRPKYYSGDRFHLAADITVNARLREMGWRFEKLPGVGRIFYETFFPRCDGVGLSAEEALRGVPFDPSSLSEGKRRQYMIDSDSRWNDPSDRGETGEVVLRPGDPDPFGVPVGKVAFGEDKKPRKPPDRQKGEPELCEEEAHVGAGEDPRRRQSWDRSCAASVQRLRQMKREAERSAEEDGFRERLWQRPTRPGLNWKTLLNNFIREDIYDYSFAPPDRRYPDEALFLPDYNVADERVKDVLFMVDTSGSVSERMLNAVYAELTGALEQFGGKLSGTVGFFDTAVRGVRPFSRIDDLRSLVPVGGGGTDYTCVFSYCEHVCEEPPGYIVIFTDGEAPFPDVSAARDIPVLWLFSKPTAAAPWGKSAYVPRSAD